MLDKHGRMRRRVVKTLATPAVMLPILPFAPLLRAAARDGARPLPVVEAAPGLYVHIGRHEEPLPSNGGDIATMSFVVGGDSVAVFDSGYSLGLGRGLLAALREVTDKPVSHVVASHVHPDHIFGHDAFSGEAPLFCGHERLPQAMAQVGPYYLRGLAASIGEDHARGSVFVPPTLTVSLNAPLRIDLGGRVLELEAWPTSHTTNDLTLHDFATNTLLSGDMLFEGRIPTFDGSVRQWARSLDVLKSRDYDGVVCGHGRPMRRGWRQTVAALQRYLNVVMDDIRAVLRRGGDISEAVATAGASEVDSWALFDRFHAGNVTFAFAELEWE